MNFRTNLDQVIDCRHSAYPWHKLNFIMLIKLQYVALVINAHIRRSMRAVNTIDQDGRGASEPMFHPEVIFRSLDSGEGGGEGTITPPVVAMESSR